MIVILMIIAAHTAALRLFQSHTELVNKAISFGLQFVGGLAVLYSIDENLGTFKNKNLKKVVLNWFKSCPIGKKPVVLTVEVNESASGSSVGQVSVEVPAVTLEERLARLDSKINEVRQFVSDLDKKMNAELSKLEHDLHKQLTEKGAEVARLSSRVEESIAGGFKLQLFGVALVIYGAWVGSML